MRDRAACIWDRAVLDALCESLDLRSAGSLAAIVAISARWAADGCLWNQLNVFVGEPVVVDDISLVSWGQLASPSGLAPVIFISRVHVRASRSVPWCLLP
jgi:hypothetical protein